MMAENLLRSQITKVLMRFDLPLKASSPSNRSNFELSKELIEAFVTARGDP